MKKSLLFHQKECPQQQELQQRFDTIQFKSAFPFYFKVSTWPFRAALFLFTEM
jgi:hypothetical protein